MSPIAPTVDGKVLHDITMKEREITGEARPVKDGPTAQGQKHIGEPISGRVISDVAHGEMSISHKNEQAPGGPTALLQSKLTSDNNTAAQEHLGNLNPATISAITAAEKEFIGSDSKLISDGPTAMAQKHAGEHINHDNLHDIMEGEKNVTDQARPVKGGPTAVAQSELSQSRKRE